MLTAVTFMLALFSLHPRRQDRQAADVFFVTTIDLIFKTANNELTKAAGCDSMDDVAFLFSCRVETVQVEDWILKRYHEVI